MEGTPPPLELPAKETLPEPSPWVTVYISGGKKDKISKIDIVGFFSNKGKLEKDDIGKIEVMDFMSFAAVKKNIVGRLLKAIQSEKMKGKKYKIEVAK
jgi:hypothetical protein